MDPKRRQIKFLVEAELLLPSPYERLMEEKFSASDKAEVEKIVRSMLKDKATEDRIVRIIRNVLVQLYKTFYNRRAFWTNNLSANPE